MRMTQKRSFIYNLIAESVKPVNVKSLHELLPEKMNLSTVYRSLDFLENEDYIRSFAIGHARFYYVPQNHEHGHFLLCRKCHEIIPFAQCAIGRITDELSQQYKFQISNHLFFFEGLCATCLEFTTKKETLK